jgi:hypothetical protein
MKIREVIVEANPGPVAGWLGKAGARLFGQTAAKMASRSEALEVLTQAWVKELEAGSKTLTHPSNIIDAKYANDLKLADEARTNAIKIVKDARFARGAEAMAQSISKGMNVVLATAAGIGAEEAIREAYNDIQAINKRLSTDKSYTQDKYDADLRSILGAATTKFVVAMSAFGAAKLGGWAIKAIPVLPNKLGTLVQSTAALDAVAFGGFISVDPGRQYFAQWYIGEAVGIIPGMSDSARNVIGNWSGTAYNYLSKSIKQIGSGNLPDRPFKDDPNAAADDTNWLPTPGKKEPQYDPVTKTYKASDLN